jgi:hypothetical protein
MIVEERSMGNTEGPKLGISNFRPMDGGVEHAGSCDGHRGLNAAFGNAIVVVGSDSGETRCLVELFQMALKLFRSECASVVRSVGERHDAEVTTVLLESTFARQGLVRVQVDLRRDEDVSGGVIDEDGAAAILLLLVFLAVGVLETTTSGANEVINGDFLTGKQLVSLQSSSVISNSSSKGSGSCTTTLLSVLTGGTHWRSRYLGSGRLKTTGALAVGEHSRAKQELHLLEGEVTETVVPS